MSRLILAVIACILCSHAAFAATPNVAVLNNCPSALGIQKLYRDAGYAATLIGESELDGLKAPDTALLVVPPGSVFPPAARKALSTYLASGGNLADLSPQAFNFNPQPVDPKPIVDFSNEGTYSVIKPKSGMSTLIDLPDGKAKGISLLSRFVWDGELGVSIPLDAHRSAGRTMICFDARGDYDIDCLKLAIKDDAGNTYVAFVELGRGWRHYSVSMADFVRITDGKDPVPLDPAKARTLTLSINYKVVWKDVKGSLSLGTVSLAKADRFAGVPTSQIIKWPNRYTRSGAPFPDWIIDPFLDARKMPDGSRREVPTPPHFRGSQDMEIGDALETTDVRRTPTLRSNGNTVAEIRTFIGGKYAGSSQILFGIENGDYSTGNKLGKALVSASNQVLKAARILSVTPATTAADTKPMHLLCKVKVMNPLPSDVNGSVNVSVGKMRGSKTSVLKANTPTEVTVDLGEVPESFPLTKFKWHAEVEARGLRDTVEDTVDVERSLIKAGIYMMSVQKGHPDGRFSIYFFTDIYAARTLFALSNYLKDPAVWKRNADLLAGMKSSDFSDAAFRFCDMIVSRQEPSGGISIGYAERDNLLFTADDGTIILGLLHIASHMADDARKARYLDASRKYFQFRESLYVSAEKSKRLQEEFGKDSPGTQEGLYGLGFLNSDMLAKNGVRWPSPKMEERGIPWVMTISMGPVAGLSMLYPSEPKYHEVVLRDASKLIKDNYTVSRSSYFHVECLFWMYQAVDNPQIKAELLKKIEQFMPFVLGDGSTIYYFQGRGSLHWLNLAYYRRLVGEDSRTRAATVMDAWRLCSETSGYSMKGIADRFPNTVYGPSCGGFRVVAHSSAAFMEMLSPGSTMIEIH